MILARQKLSATGDLHLRLRSLPIVCGSVIQIVFGGPSFRRLSARPVLIPGAERRGSRVRLWRFARGAGADPDRPQTPAGIKSGRRLLPFGIISGICPWRSAKDGGTRCISGLPEARAVGVHRLFGRGGLILPPGCPRSGRRPLASCISVSLCYFSIGRQPPRLRWNALALLLPAGAGCRSARAGHVL